VNTVSAHYEQHLAPVYAWMLGDIDAALARSAAELDDIGLPAGGRHALDLGAGLGLHALPLARRGYAVTALDSSQWLLDELAARAGELSIKRVHAEVQEFRAHVPERVDVILCMGDTLTHLPSFFAVEQLMTDIAGALGPRGVFAATFRDYASRTLQGEERFILVRGDEQRVMTCFLEYTSDHIAVYDVLQERHGAVWRQRVSSYPKLRLAPERVVALLSERGLTARRESGPGGMARVIATKG
jgi:SAM-dependent methyltransferase